MICLAVAGSTLGAGNPFDGVYTGKSTSNAGGDSVTIQGRITGGVLAVDVTNPPCEYHWHLKKN